MKRIIFLFIVLFPFLSFGQQELLIKNVSVVDVKNGTVKRNETVLIRGNKIVSVSTKPKVPKNIRVIQAEGKYLIPGLWDMHVHDVCDLQYGKNVYMPLFIANGITGVRDMGGPDSGTPDTVFKIRNQINEGRLVGPHIVAAGYFIMGNVWGPKEVIRVSNDSSARQAVDFIKEAGADFIKVKELVPRDAYFAIEDEAKKINMVLAGHVPFSIDAKEAAEARQKSIEHLDGIWFTCSADCSRLREEVFDAELKMFQGRNSQSSSFRKMIYALDTASKTFSSIKADSAFRKFVLLNTWVCPTLVMNRALASSGDTSNLENQERLRYIPDEVARMWNPKLNGRTQQVDSADWILLKENFERSLHLVKLMKDAGVKLLAGTDASPRGSSIPYLFPGFSLLDELQLYVKAGLTPLEAIQTATINPAKFLNMENESGTVEPNKYADLVLLDANPLQNIKNITKIDAVIIKGHFISKTAIKKMLENAGKEAKK